MIYKSDKPYNTEYGEFQILKTRFMYKSQDKNGKDLVFGLTPEAVYFGTTMHLEAHALGLKEEKSYAGTVSGKL